MSYIKPEHAEWAVVDRLRRLLEDSKRSEFNVTQALSLFSLIVCWTVQRIRSRGDRISKLMEPLHNSLAQSSCTVAPWNTEIVDYKWYSNSKQFVEWRSLSAMDLITALRNSIAHGDDRTIAPKNGWDGKEEKLVGFDLCLLCEDRSKKPVWKGRTQLLESDLQRIGKALADLFCQTIDQGDEDFKRLALSLAA